MKQFSLKDMKRILGSSMGAQPKYYENGYWYKQDQKGYEGLAEYLVGELLRFSDADSFVRYERCRIDERNGCRSRDFCRDDEIFMSFERLYQLRKGCSMADAVLRLDSIRERISLALDFMQEETGLDLTSYLQRILSLDALTLNVDRHLNNLGIILNEKTGEVREAPIFDNGGALLSDFSAFDPYEPIEKNMDRAKGKPFYSDLMVQADAAGFLLKIDYPEAFRFLDSQPPHRAVDVLRIRMELFRDLFERREES